MASEKSDALAFEESGDDGFGGIPSGPSDATFYTIGEAFHGIEAAAADDADGGLRFFGSTLLLCFQSCCSLSHRRLAPCEFERLTSGVKNP
jgi:hypothetical protein